MRRIHTYTNRDIDSEYQELQKKIAYVSGQQDVAKLSMASEQHKGNSDSEKANEYRYKHRVC